MISPAEIELSVMYQGEPLVLPLAEFDGTMARDYRRVTGTKLAALVEDRNPDLDQIAGLIWLQLRKDDPDLSYDTVVANYTLADHARTQNRLIELFVKAMQETLEENRRGKARPVPDADAANGT